MSFDRVMDVVALFALTALLGLLVAFDSAGLLLFAAPMLPIVAVMVALGAMRRAGARQAIR